MDAHERSAIRGIHHITLVASHAARTVKFYVDMLGLTFVKKTVNFDAPTTYHLYFGDEMGSPGTLVTFFEWPDAEPGQIGIGTTHHLALTVDSFEGLLKWKTWLQHGHHLVAGPFDHGAYSSIIVTDPDGVIVEITTAGPGWQALLARDEFIPGHEGMARETWPEPVMSVSEDMRLRSLHHIAAISSDLERTHAFYGEVLGIPLLYRSQQDDAPRWYWSTGTGIQAGRPSTVITYTQADAEMRRGHIGHGLTHHFAFEVPDDELEPWRDRLLVAGLHVTPVKDRKYFRSIYFKDPDGHILEIATSGPGFLVDQPRGRLGVDLALPDWLEPRRPEIESALPPIEVHP